MGAYGRDGGGAGAGGGCCACCSRVICSSLLAILLLITLVLSVIACACSNRYWMYFNDHAQVDPYVLETGWLRFQGSQIGLSGTPWLVKLNWDVWLIGVICFAFLGFSALLALIEFFVVVRNQGGKHTGVFGVTLGVCIIGLQLAFFGCAFIEIRNYTQNAKGVPYNAWPNWAWALGIAAGLLWALMGFMAMCMSPRAPRTTAPTKSDASATSGAATPGSYPPAGYGTGNGVAAGAAGAGVGTAAGRKRSWFGRGRRAQGPQGAMTTSQYDVESPPAEQAPPARAGPAIDSAAEPYGGGNAAGFGTGGGNTPSAPPVPDAVPVAASAPRQKRGLFGFGRNKQSAATDAAVSPAASAAPVGQDARNTNAAPAAMANPNSNGQKSKVAAMTDTTSNPYDPQAGDIPQDTPLDSSAPVAMPPTTQRATVGGEGDQASGNGSSVWSKWLAKHPRPGGQ